MSDNEGAGPSAREAEEDRLLDELEDELSASSGEDEDEEAAPAAKKPKAKRKPKEAKPKKKRSAYIDDAAEEDAEGGAGGRKLKRSRFIDDIAEVDDDEDEDEEDGEGMDDLIDDRGEAPDAADLAEVRQAMRDAERRVAEEEDINPEAMQRYIAERYGGARGAAYTAGDDGGDGAAGGAVAQQALMPTARDANLWVVRCVDGAEREIVCCLLQKCYDYAARGQPLLIKAAFAKDALKGYLYVEAFKESHVREALKGMRSIFHSKPPRLVPLGEMVGAIAVRRAESRALAPGAWVRLRTGLYKGDLARVTDVDASGGRATVKLVPRLDLAAMAARRPEDARANFGKAPKVRPPARAFNPEEARGARLDVSQQRDRATGELFWSLGGAQRFAGGYLVKGVSLKSVVPETSLPPLDELQRFNAAAADDGGAGGAAPGRPGDLAALVAGLAGEGGGEELAAAAGRGRFAKGDRVVVTEGELKGLRGRVAHVTEGGEVHVRLAQDGPLGADFADLVPFPPRELAKLFAEGEHVKVAHGQHAGETGMVLRVDGGVCHVLTDATRQEIRAFGRDLEEAVAVASSLDSLGDYDLFDLVVLDPQTVGVIVGVDKDSVRVLTNQGRPEKPDLRVCGLPDLKRKMDSKRASAQDGMRNEVSLNDIVEVFDGPLKGRSGTVKHIMRGFLFVQSREVPEHGGFTCVQARHCKVRGGRRLPGPAGAPGVLATPARAYAGAGAAGGGAMGVMASPARQGGFGAPGAAGGYTGRVAMRQDKLLENKVVDIRKGPYRGMRGRIVSATPTHVRVELEAQMKTVTVDRAHLPPGEGLVEGQHAARPGMGMGAGLGMGAAYGYGVAGYGVAGYGAPGAGAAAPGGRTPAHYSQAQATPAHYSMLGGSTPLHPGMTPGREAVTATPAYDAAWAATPAHPGFGGGGGGFGGGGGHDPFAGHGFGAPPPPSVGSAPYAPYGAPAPPPYGAAAPPPAPYSVPPASMPPPPAPAPPPPAPVPPPAPGGLPQDWVGLEVCLLSGQRAAVRSVDHQGAASVQLGQEAPPGSGALAFADGPVRVVRVADLALAPVAKGDRVRLLGGELKGMVVVLDLVEAGEVFFKRAGGEVALEPAARAGKLAPDAAA